MPASLPALPRFIVQLEPNGEMLSVQCAQSDMLRWEENQHKYKWPDGEHAPFLLAWFLAWCALGRENRLPAGMVKWEDFKKTAVGVGPDGTDDPATPTDPVPATA